MKSNWVIGGLERSCCARLGLKRTTLLAKMQKLGISLEKQTEPRIGHLNSDEQAAVNPVQRLVV